MKTILFAISLVALLLLRPYQLEKSNLIYHATPSDDLSYLGHATSLAFLSFPTYKGEQFINNEMPMHSVGPGLLAAPFVLLFSQLDRISNPVVFDKRQMPEVLTSWTSFGFVFATLFYFCLSCLLLQKTIQSHYSEKTAVRTVLFLFLFQGFALFAYRRPVFSHVYELFIQTCVVFLFSRNQSIKLSKLGVISGALSGLMVLTRYNNVFMALGWPFIYLYKNFKTKVKNKNILYFCTGTLCTFLFLVLFFKVLPTFYLGKEKYNLSRELHWNLFTPNFLSYRFFKLIFGYDWGLFWTAPFTLIGFIGCFLLNSKWNWLKLLLALCSVNLVTVLIFGSQGGWYGYRYLLFTLTPVVAFGFAEVLNRYYSKPKFKLALIVMSVFPIFSMLAFEGNPTNLTLQIIPQDGRTDWGNATYQLEVWRSFLLHPISTILVFLKGVPAYFAFLFGTAIQKTNLLPEVLLSKYDQGVQELTFLRVLILFSAPFISAAFFKKLKT